MTDTTPRLRRTVLPLAASSPTGTWADDETRPRPSVVNIVKRGRGVIGS